MVGILEKGSETSGAGGHDGCVKGVSWSLVRRWVFSGLLGLMLVACSGKGGGGSAPPATTALASQSGGLQFREVRATRAEACGGLAENHAGDQPVTLGGRDGACYDLGPAVLTVRRAQAHIEAVPGGMEVLLNLSPADTPVFGRILAANLQKQVAVVMFGSVQSAPTIHDAETDGTIAIAGLDSQTATNVVSVLSG